MNNIAIVLVCWMALGVGLVQARTGALGAWVLGSGLLVAMVWILLLAS